MRYNIIQVEKLQSFLDRFKEIVHNYETVPGSIPLADEEKRDALYNAIRTQIPKVQSAEFITKNQTGKGLTYDLLKSFITQAKANRLKSSHVNHPGSKIVTI